jgi:hypothetical protein
MRTISARPAALKSTGRDLSQRTCAQRVMTEIILSRMPASAKVVAEQKRRAGLHHFSNSY